MSRDGAPSERTEQTEQRNIRLTIPEISPVPPEAGERDVVKEKYARVRDWSIPIPFIQEQLKGSLSGLVVLEVVGDEMSRSLPAGSCVFVSLARNEFTDDGMYIIETEDGSFRPRRLHSAVADLSGDVQVKCDSPEVEDRSRQLEEINIVGRVVGIIAGVL